MNNLGDKKLDIYFHLPKDKQLPSRYDEKAEAVWVARIPIAEDLPAGERDIFWRESKASKHALIAFTITIAIDDTHFVFGRSFVRRQM